MKNQKIKPPVNFNICSTELGRLIEEAVEDNLLLLDTIIGLQKQEKELIKSSKMTVNKKSQEPKE